MIRHDLFLESLLPTGSYKKLYSYTSLINGFALHTSSDQALEILNAAMGIRMIQEDIKLIKLTTHTPQYLNITTRVWPSLGGGESAGEGIVVGMIDTGINPNHPSFSNHGFENQRVKKPLRFKGGCEAGDGFPLSACSGKIVGAQFFARAAIAAGDFNATRDFASPFDSDGHGSHTASVVAGNYGTPVVSKGYNYGYASGMAPGASLAIYKALFPFGGYMSDVVAAIDKAVEDGVDILSLSMGPSSIPSESTRGSRMYPMATVSDVSTGNSNPSCLNPEAFDPSLARGKIIICEHIPHSMYARDNIGTVFETMRRIRAVGVIITSDEDLPDDDIGVESTMTLPLPGIVLSTSQDSKVLLDYYNSNTLRSSVGHVTTFGATVRIQDGRRAIYTGDGPIVASYSSRGPDLNNNLMEIADVLKPNIMAPGSAIWAAWSPDSLSMPENIGEEFAMLSGTSMATPHIAGIAALIKQKHPDWSPAAITSAMMTTADTTGPSGHRIQAQSQVGLQIASPFDYGAGLINPARALNPGLIFDVHFENYIQFLCAVPGVDEGSIRQAVGVSNCPTASMRWGSDLNTPSITVANLIGSRRVMRRVTSVGKETETYVANVKEPAGVAVSVTPKVFTISPNMTKGLRITLKAKEATNTFTFGEVVLKGDKKHVVRVPLAIAARSTLKL
ncbi:hypothetical protein LUZ60_016897 [Juncus effusus]|nr:hypothetical protein LUZ60_016897 [Juncus effusus]